MARIRSDFFVAAHLRRCAVEGVDAVLRRRGAAEAGAIFVSVDRLDGTIDLYGPAPQSLVGEDKGGRVFAPVLTGAEPAAIETRMRRELGFDPDLWWIGIDDRQGRALLDLAEDPGTKR
ncbi:MAG: DUF1491 family protein [Methylobacteriaceae bacterium]|nr:DUF1491 family protein [Methylobacteriaceae bacterium]